MSEKINILKTKISSLNPLKKIYSAKVKLDKIKNLTSKEQFKTTLTQAKKEFSNSLKDDDYKREVRRKIFHTTLIMLLPAIYIFLTKNQMLSILIPTSVLMILADFIRQKNPRFRLLFNLIFGKIMRQKELSKNGWVGSSATSLSALIIFIISPKIIAICAFSILAISDALAALIGKRITSRPFFEKSLAGSLSFGFSALLILIICGTLSSQGIGYYLFGFFAVLATTIIEARPSLLKLDDNLSIPLVFGVIMVFFSLVWNLNY
ncbi:MAG: dolichol kinase [Lentimonas sp.]|jgi:dolichol kinase